MNNTQQIKKMLHRKTTLCVSYKKTRGFGGLWPIFLIGVVSGMEGGRYDATKDCFNHRKSLGSHGRCFRNCDTAACHMENSVGGITGF